MPLGLQLQAETQARQLVSSCIWTSCQLVTSCIWKSCQLVTYCIWLLTATGYLDILSTASGCPVNWLLHLDVLSASYCIWMSCQLVTYCIWMSCQLVTYCIWMSCQLVTAPAHPVNWLLNCIWMSCQLVTSPGHPVNWLLTASGCPVNWLLTASGYLDCQSTSYLPHLDVLSIARDNLGMSTLLSQVNTILKLFCKPFLQNQSIHRCPKTKHTSNIYL